MGRATELIDATPGFLRSLDEAGLFIPSAHPEASRHQANVLRTQAAQAAVCFDAEAK